SIYPQGHYISRSRGSVVFANRPAPRFLPRGVFNFRAAARPPFFHFRRGSVRDRAPQRRSIELGPAPTATTSSSPPMIDKFSSTSVRLLLNASPDISQKWWVMVAAVNTI